MEDLDFNTEDTKLVIARKLFLFCDQTTFERRGQALMEWVVRAPILTVVVGLFAPGINPMPENVPICKRKSQYFSVITSPSRKIFLQKTWIR